MQFLVIAEIDFRGEILANCRLRDSRGSLRSCSSEMSDTHNPCDRVALCDREIVDRSRPSEKWLESGPNSCLVEAGTICTPFCADEPRPGFSSAISRTSSVASFRGSDTGSKHVAFFLGPRQACKSTGSEALHSDSPSRNPQSQTYFGASALQQAQRVDFVSGSENSRANESSDICSRSLFCADISSEGERCMKHRVHPVVHPSVHPRISGRVRSERGCAGRDDQFGRGQHTGLGWSDPTFVHVSVPKVIRGVAPAQLRSDRAECFARAAFRSRGPQ